MSKAREAGRKHLTPGELYLHDELEAMRKENEGAHAQISLNIGKHVGRLHDAMDSQFRAVNERFDKADSQSKAVNERFDKADSQSKAVNERFDKLEKMVLRAIDMGKARI